jgi:hypothetical protein
MTLIALTAAEVWGTCPEYHGRHEERNRQALAQRGDKDKKRAVCCVYFANIYITIKSPPIPLHHIVKKEDRE